MLNDILNVSLMKGGKHMKQYQGFLVDDDLNIYSARTKRKLTPHVGSDGYLQVSCRDENQKLIHQRVHVIYGHTVVHNPDPEHLHYINHKDSNKMNCDPSNLEWTTNSENVKHGWASGNRTHKNRTKVSATKDGITQVFGSIRELGQTLHLDRHKVARILKGELSPDYLSYTFNYI